MATTLMKATVIVAGIDYGNCSVRGDVMELVNYEFMYNKVKLINNCSSRQKLSYTLGKSHRRYQTHNAVIHK